MAGEWTDEQNDAIVADYFAMLADDIAGRPYSKANHNGVLQSLTGRPRGSIEYKHQNISAVLKGLREDWLPGHKPAFNFQASLAAGRTDLAHRLRQCSDVDGDGAGYDIKSFEPDGRDRLIEVRTTNGWERTPFHITRNELTVYEAYRDDQLLLRLWNFAREPRAFELRPPLEAHVSLMATSYQAHFLQRFEALRAIKTADFKCSPAVSP